MRDEVTLVIRPKLPPTQLWIGGEWQEAEAGRTFPSENPATEEIVCEVASASANDVDRAVLAARHAFDGDWGKSFTPRERGHLLWRIADALEHAAEDFANLETLDNGKPVFESRFVDLPAAVEALRYFAGWADKISGETVAVQGPFVLGYTLPEPIGVVAAITPWSFPLVQAVWKIAAALACGNTVVLKPASPTPLTALLFADLAHEVGLPAGVLNVLPGDGAVVGEALVRHSGVDKVSFSGSTAVGRGVMRRAADTLKRLTLALGGKSPNIIFADADLEAAVKGAHSGIFYGQGEVCTAGSRLFVERSVHDEVVERLLERARQLRPGDPTDPKTRLGALISARHRKQVLEYVEIARQEGARLLCGGRPATVADRGYFMEPTVFDQVTNSMRVAQEEVFGPLLAVIAFDDPATAVQLANESDYGIAAGVWTRDIGRAHRVAAELRAGTVWINQYNWLDAAAPFGGFKRSGLGRELGRQALAGYTETKMIYVGK